MIRKLILLVAMAVTAMAFSASAASAQIEVHNAGDIEIHGETTLALGQHTPMGFVAGLSCQNHWTGTVSHSGHVQLTNVNLDPHPGDIGNCEDANDCADAGWEGQIEEEDGLETIHQHFCLILPGSGLSGVPARVECFIQPGGATAHCDSPVLHEPTGAPLGPEVVGEVGIEPPLDIEHP